MMLRTLLSRLLGSLRLSRLDRDFSRELESHLAMLEEDGLRRGLTQEEARRQAQVRLGGLTQLREIHREQRGLPLLERVAQDARHALCLFRRSPAFTLFAGAALALGIAANTAVFSVADAVLLRPLPYRDPSRLVIVWQDNSALGFPRNNVSPKSFSDWRQRSHAFDRLAAMSFESFSLTGNGNPDQVQAKTVTGDFFSVLGVAAAAGRTLQPADDEPGAPLAAVLGYGLWKRSFGGDAGVIGRDVVLNGSKYTVVGVMPPGFQFLDRRTEVWVPSQLTNEMIDRRRNDHFLTVVGRLKGGVTLEAANRDLESLASLLRKETGRDAGRGVAVRLRDQLAGNQRTAIWVLLGAVCFVLLIACANLANLLLARGSARSREMALRLALGAGRRRVIEQMLTESLLLAAAAGLAGLALAQWLTRFLGGLVPAGIVPLHPARLDGRVLAFTAVISVATGVLFGIVPALCASQLELVAALKQGGGRSGAGGQRLRDLLVVSEIALAIVLLGGAALMIRSFERLYHQDPGFRAEHVLVLRTELPSPKYQDFARRTAFYRDVLERVQRLPGVAAAGYATRLPLENPGGGSVVTLENHPAPDFDHLLIPNVRVVSPGYFRTIGMKLVAGRFLDERDGDDSPRVAVINDTMARRFWPGENPIGRRFKRGLWDSKSPWFTVVGIVGDMRQGGMNVPVRPEAYFPYRQADFFAPSALAVRTAADPMALSEAVRRQVWAVDKEQPASDVMTLEDMVEESVAASRMETGLFGGFAAMALLLAALGIYAVLSFAVAQRTQEIGVRVALGARPPDVLRMVLAHGARLYLCGAAIGCTAAVLLSRLLRRLLFGISHTDPISYISVTLLLAAVVLLACYLPARRAMRVDPMVALRYE